MRKHEITTQRELRRRFWQEHPKLNRRRVVRWGAGKRDYVCDTRVTWCDWVENLARNGTISCELADRATL